MSADPPSPLRRRLGTGDAVTIGLGSMIGAGVFVAIGPAARAAGSRLLIGLGIAAVVACCNATSSARLAVVYPSSGGAYVSGREQLGHLWGFLAGWGFVVGKTASCAAMALTFGNYVAPDDARVLGIGAVVVLALVNLSGLRKTVWLTRLILVVVITALALVVYAALTGGLATARLGPIGAGGATGILESAGLLFFSFAGYARITTLGDEVRDPRRTIPRAIPIALGITLAIYATVAGVSLLAVGPTSLAAARAPLVAVVEAGDLAAVAPVVRVGAAVASVGVLLSLLVGVSRTTFAMASRRDLPSWLGAVDPVREVPRRAEVVVASLVVVVIAVADVREAIGFSSFGVLAYYGVANASAWTLPTGRRLARMVAATGLCGCVVLAASLPAVSVIGGLAMFACGAGVWGVRQMRSRPR